MSPHFYDRLSNLIINPFTEMKNLHYLFSEEPTVPMQIYIEPLETYINNEVFRNLKIRGTFLNTQDMREALGIAEFQLDNSLEKLFLFSEFLLSIFMEGEDDINNLKAKEIITVIINNILSFVEKSNHMLYDIGDNRFIIVEKNKAAAQSLEFIEDTNIALEVIEYNHYKLKGNLQEKRKILCELANFIEPILKNGVFNSQYKELQSDVGFLLNSFHIRHNNKDGKKAQEYLKTIDESTLELWYYKPNETHYVLNTLMPLLAYMTDKADCATAMKCNHNLKLVAGQ